MNTWFKAHPRRLYTWTSPNGKHRNQIDYITINRRFRNTIISAKTYPGADCNSDHIPVVGVCRLKLKNTSKKQTNKQVPLTIKEIKNDLELSKEFKESVMERYQKVTRTGIDEEWGTLKNAITDTINEMKGKQEIKQADTKQEWITTEILNLMEMRRKAKNTPQYKELNKLIKKKCCEAKEFWINGKCTEIEALQVAHSDIVYKKINELCGHKMQNRSGFLKTKDNKIVFSKTEKLNTWYHYLNELYDDEDRSILNTTNYRNEGPSILKEEIKKAIQQTGKNKAPGLDGITREMLEVLEDEGVEITTKIANLIYDTGYMPTDWTKSVFITLPKKPHATDCEQYRTICLISHTLKIISKVILERIRPKIRKEISAEQNGFLPGKGTTNAIFTLRMIVERCIEVNKNVYLCFVDFSKAFDRVKHDKVFRLLEDLQIDGKDLRLIKNMYWMQTAAVKIEGTLSKFTKIKKGVRQGCILSPDLFNLYSEQAFKAIKYKKGICFGGKMLNNIRFADDAILIAESHQDLQELLYALNTECKNWGLEINRSKTSYMVMAKGRTETRVQDLMLEGVKLIRTKTCKYLGSIVSDNGNCDQEIKTRIATAKQAFTKMKNILTSNNISNKTKTRVIKTYVWSVLTYGCECWTLNKRTINSLSATEMWLYRKSLKIKWSDKIKNSEVLHRMQTHRQLVNAVLSRQLNFFGHIVRRNGLEWDVCCGKILGTKGRGRPRQNFISHLLHQTEIPNFEDLARLAKDRDNWRSLTAYVCSRHAT